MTISLDKDEKGAGDGKPTMLSSLKSTVPWWAKIAMKVGYSRFSTTPFWREPGNRKDNVRYAYSVFKKHFENVNPPSGFVCLELGPGGMATAAVLTKAFGGARSIQVDVEPLADMNITGYKQLADYARAEGQAWVDLDQVSTFASLLARCNSCYLTEGLNSLRTIPSQSVDFIYSQSCLEHVRLDEFKATIGELRRILKDAGSASHRVDLRDHLQSALNNLRFSDAAWEGDLMSSSGFYTNRIRFREMLEIFEACGFDCVVSQIDRWPSMPTPREKLIPRFRELPDDELLVQGFNVICRPK